MPNVRGTTNTPIRFTDQDREDIRKLQSHWGSPTIAATLRRAVKLAVSIIEPASDNSSGKSRDRS